MDIDKICQNILEPLEKMATFAGTGYIEILFKGGSRFVTAFKKVYSPDFPYLSFEILNSNSRLEKLEKLSHTEQLSKYKETIHCYIYPVYSYRILSGFLILQGKSPFTEEFIVFAESIAQILNNFYRSVQEDAAQEKNTAGKDKDAKYHNELMNMRDIQARLFPKFDNIEELDIRSAYLPAELIAGTFIDGFFSDKSTYTLVACDFSDYGTASFFIGAAIRTIIRSEEVQKMIPSMMISTIENRIRNLTSVGNIANICLTIFQINLKGNKAVISSYGPVSTLFYTAKKHGIIDLDNTEAGKIFIKKRFFRDLTINMDTGDTLLYYSRGVLRAKKEGSATEYGIEQLKVKIVENITNESLELVHSITESVYEFTDYEPLKEDIILISIKKI